MLASTNHRDFNNAMNEAAGTQGVQYSHPWNLGVENGTEFLNNYYHDVGKVYALELLKQPQESVLHDFRGELSDLQKGLLQHMSRTTTMHEFDKAMHACVRHNVLSSGASALFCKHTPLAMKEHSGPNSTEPSSLEAMVESIISESPLPSENVEMEDALLPSDDSDSLKLSRRGKNRANLTLVPKSKRQKN